MHTGSLEGLQVPEKGGRKTTKGMVGNHRYKRVDQGRKRATMREKVEASDAGLCLGAPGHLLAFPGLRVTSFSHVSSAPSVQKPKALFSRGGDEVPTTRIAGGRPKLGVQAEEALVFWLLLRQ